MKIHEILSETPKEESQGNLMDTFTRTLKEYLSNGTTKINNTLRKTNTSNVIYYWYVDNNENVLLGAEIEKQNSKIKINFVAKRDQNSPPFASDLYIDILNDQKRSNPNTILISDDKLSNNAFALWSRLLTQGHEIYIYDKTTKNITHVVTIDDLKGGYGSSNQYQNYQYILKN